MPLEMTADGLDFRKLGHGCLPSSIEGGPLDHMISRPELVAAVLLGALAMAGADAHAAGPVVDTILRRAPAEDSPVPPPGLGPARLQGDLVDDLLAAAGDDS